MEELALRGPVELDLVDAAGLRGISVQVHPRCGTVHLHVDPSGRLVNHAFYGFVAAFWATIQVVAYQELRGEKESTDIEELASVFD